MLPEWHEQYRGNNQTVVKSNPISISYYIARNNKEKAIELLKQYGINISEPQTPERIARGLEYLIKNGNSKDTAKVIDLHPDKDIVIDKAKEYDGFIYSDGTQEPQNKPQPEQQVNNQSPINNNQSVEPIIGVKVAYTLLGSGITLAILAMCSWAVKNIKQN